MFKKNLAAKLTLVPSAVVIAVCFYGTILWTLYISLTHSTMLPNYKFYGFGQYATLLSMPRWHTAFANMLIFGSLFIVGSLVIGTTLAALLDRNVKAEGLFRVFFLYPLSMSFVVTGLAWQWLLNPTTGVEALARSFGWQDFSFNWLASPEKAIYAVSIAAIWQSSGLVMAIMLAGLRGIDSDIWKATKIDGIPVWRSYISIVLPMLRPLILTCVILLATAVVKSYDLVVAMTGGGPGISTDVPGKFVVDLLFQRANISTAAAAAMLMLLTVICALSPYVYIELKRQKR
ncbi:carbohydrate ABC transporter permease [Rhizobium lusitanum]|uniref:carbohydrate ABC transporter permease n=1 Tax=Rhizobium lusitanum TaxID=293958 RepID=UPI001573AB1A|nr:sugar ABC transporter permease [Rhizobium lusitanum]NTJ09283.1 sugar ABC transporter permease [Rhizobium lusitanum]